MLNLIPSLPIGATLLLLGIKMPSPLLTCEQEALADFAKSGKEAQAWEARLVEKDVSVSFQGGENGPPISVNYSPKDCDPQTSVPKTGIFKGRNAAVTRLANIFRERDMDLSALTGIKVWRTEGGITWAKFTRDDGATYIRCGEHDCQEKESGEEEPTIL